MITGTYKLYPAYCRTPVISEGDRTLMTATDLLEKFKKIVSCSAKQKVIYCNTLRDLTNVICNHKTQRDSTSNGDGEP